MTNRILLVDNEDDNNIVFKMALEDGGFEVDVYNDSLLALSNFKDDLYDLVILDINIPKMNGYDLYKEIRKIDNKVKVCFLSASEIYDKNLQKVSPPSDVKCFISKPIQMNDLVRIVKTELNN
ncbi:MAG TPA: response regulator [Nitrososphaeraceae archaeon]|jgi:two-component system, OmpR family, response regulator ChvI|nr:response regulator [Nitrososphaeraceae archaeon]